MSLTAQLLISLLVLPFAVLFFVSVAALKKAISDRQDRRRLAQLKLALRRLPPNQRLRLVGKPVAGGKTQRQNLAKKAIRPAVERAGLRRLRGVGPTEPRKAHREK